MKYKMSKIVAAINHMKKYVMILLFLITRKDKIVEKTKINVNKINEINKFNRKKINESSSKPSEFKIINDINEITAAKICDTSSQKKFDNDTKKHKITINDEINSNKKKLDNLKQIQFTKPKKHANKINEINCCYILN